MIDYNRIGRSCDYYEELGYKRIESPWLVSQEISDITKPDSSFFDWEIKGKNKVLVASGEQSFLDLYLKGFLPKGRFQTTTPCFRNEFNITHRKYFVKNELIITDEVSEKTLKEMINHARDFFKIEVGSNVKVVKTDIGYDLIHNSVELGSYGIRKCEFLEWIYGTGCDEPRVSMSILGN